MGDILDVWLWKLYNTAHSVNVRLSHLRCGVGCQMRSSFPDTR